MTTGRAAILDVDLALLKQLLPSEKRYQPILRFPSSAFDLSVVVETRKLTGDIRKELTSLAGVDLVDIEFLRQYSGPPLSEGTKSVSFRLTVASSDHTLSSDEVTAIRNRIIDGMRAIGYELRL